jgi:quinoprotein glucose dehydrogenase
MGRLGLAALAAIALGTAALAQGGPGGPARDPRLNGLDGLFSGGQAARGSQLFAASCARCHSPTQAAQLLLSQAAGQPFADYHARLMVLMPPEAAQRPTAQEYVDIVAHLMRTAGASAGEVDAAPDAAAWREARVPEGVVIDPTANIGAVAQAVEWPYYRGDSLGRAYSSANLIDRDNVGALDIAWRWGGANYGPTPETRSITTPIMVGGVLYATAGLTRNVVALDATSGETLWMWRPGESRERYENAPRKGAGRGVSWWSDGDDERIFTVTPGFHLVALDAATGQPIEGFGADGVVDLMEGLRNAPQGRLPDIGTQSPPLVIGDVVVVGPAHLVSVRPRSRSNVKGDVRGYDARTGALLWTFRTIPEPGEPGSETWEDGSAAFTGNAGVWAPMSADLESGAIFLPVEAATSDLYGGERPGANLYSSSLVSLDGRTGELRWAQQLIHHDIWDWDTPAQPILADIPQADGSTTRAVLQVTKQAFVYAFDRDTGEPLWPIEETPVPSSDVPGEQTFPTQPIPTLPEPFAPQGVTPDVLLDFTPELRAEALELASRYRMGGLFAPPSLVDAPDGTAGTLMLPHPVGGANWEGGAYDPETGMLYVGSMNQIYIAALEASPEGSDIPYLAAGGPPLRVRDLPIEKPPYGKITAIDMATGEHAWEAANGMTPDAVANHPDLQGLDIPRTGVATRAGLLVTPTLLFSGEGTGGGSWLHVHDKATGALVRDIPLPGAQTGLPMTYVWGGRQYVVMAVGDGVAPAEIVALALPE